MPFQPWELVAGLGIFLYGMMILEQALRTLGTRAFRHILRDYTNTPVRGVMMGIVSTACLQSSSMVGLIVLAFVGAGILTMANALGVIFGASLGTTFTGWIVATIGFKLSLTQYAMPLLAVGTLGTVFINTEHRRHSQARLLLGLGLLLMGLDFMKTNMGTLAEQSIPGVFADYPILLYALGGLLFTALVQSSSATMMIVLSAIHAEVMPLTTAAAIMAGANLGTTVTVVLGSLKGSPDKHRVALAHFIFHLLSTLIGLVFLYPILQLISDILTVQDPMYAVVLYHSLFNLFAILLFLPFISPFAHWLQNRFANEDGSGCQFITKVPASVSDAASEAIHQEVIRLFYRVILLNLRVLKIRPQELLQEYEGYRVYREISLKNPSYDDQYADIKHTEQQILHYANRVLQEKASSDEAQIVSGLLHAARDMVFSAKSFKDIRLNIVELRMQSDDEEMIETIRHDTRAIYRHLLNLLEKTDLILVAEKREQLDTEINLSHDRLHQMITRYSDGDGIGVPLSTLLNVNREMLVSNQMLATAVRDLVEAR